MDGLSIRNMNVTGKAGDISIGKTGTSKGLNQSPDGAGFADTLKQAINNVNELHKDSDIKMQKLATGQSDNLHETMIAVEKADIAMRLMIQVRNKIVAAYEEVMKMQV